MITTTRLAVVAALALTTTAACGADPSSMGGDDGGGGGDRPPSRPLDPTGTYAVHSTFDLATHMPGTAGAVVNTIIDATDDANDPTQWVLEQLIAQMPTSNAIERGVKDALDFGKGAIADYLNEKLLGLSPGLLPKLVQVGSDFGDIAKQFGLNETLTLTRSGTDYVAVHSIVGVHYQLGNQQGDLAFANYQVPNVVVSSITVQMDPTGQLTIAAHDVPLAYGQLLRLGLDAAIIPAIDPSARNLNDLLAHEVDCQAIASAIVSEFGIGGASTLAAACKVGLNAGANLVYNQILAIDGTALKFSINGSARAVDRDNDRQIDQIQTGTWAGTLAYGTTPTPLIPATFFGERQ
jgi:hypothetical protein